MTKKAKIKARDVYGVRRGYPADEGADLLRKLIRPRKTFNNEDVDIIVELGKLYDFSLEIEIVKAEEETAPE